MGTDPWVRPFSFFAAEGSPHLNLPPKMGEEGGCWGKEGGGGFSGGGEVEAGVGGGCNGSGKDWAAARVVLWWVNAHSPAKAIVTGPTSRQVSEIVWREMRWAYDHAPEGRLKGKMFRSSRYEVDAETFALGFATDSPYNLQGFHSPNLLVVVTEAHAVDELDMDSIRRLNPKRLLLVGNAYVSPGTFYDSHHSKKDLYERVRIRAEDTPNFKEGEDYIPGMMTPEDVADREAEWGRDDPRFVSAVLAEFPEDQDDIVVKRSWAEEAAARSLEPDGPVIVACDVARYGSSRTVVARRQGAHVRIVHRMKGQDTMKIAEYLKGYCEREGADFLVVDETGRGRGRGGPAEAASPAGAAAGGVRGGGGGVEPAVSREPGGGGVVDHAEQVRVGGPGYAERPGADRAGVDAEVPPGGGAGEPGEQVQAGEVAGRGGRGGDDVCGS